MNTRNIILIGIFVFVVLCITETLASKDFYKILGVPRDASQQQIKKAYRQLSLTYHPDKHKGDEEKKNKFEEISNAYEVLSDEEKRRTYDQYGEEGLKQGGGAKFRDPFDIFSAFTGGHGHFHGQQEEQRGPSLELDLPVTLEDLYNGKTFQLLHKKQILCPKCRGTGAKNPDDVQKCTVCGGSGVQVKTQRLGPGFVTQTQVPCEKCNGQGRIIKSTCPHCSGQKVTQGEELLTVVIEQGMPEDHSIVLDGENDQNPGVNPGDIIFKIKTQPHPLFVRRGNDLHYKTTITLLEALVGYTKTIEHLDGHKVEISSDGITKPGQIRVINEEGMPFHNFPSQKGNLFVEFTVLFPETLTEEQKEGFKKLLG
jgi:DnaJ-related protein SCJ1